MGSQCVCGLSLKRQHDQMRFSECLPYCNESKATPSSAFNCQIKVQLGMANYSIKIQYSTECRPFIFLTTEDQALVGTVKPQMCRSQAAEVHGLQPKWIVSPIEYQKNLDIYK
jgi:hypothetical protein